MGYKFNLTDEEISELAVSFLEKMDNRESRKLEIMKSKGEEILEKLYSDLLDKGVVHDDSLLYNAESYSINEEEYSVIFDCMLSFPEESKKCQDDENFFEHSIFYYEYKDKLIEVFIMWGQGTATSFSLHEKEELLNIGEEFYISITDFLNYYKLL